MFFITPSQFMDFAATPLQFDKLWNNLIVAMYGTRVHVYDGHKRVPPFMAATNTCSGLWQPQARVHVYGSHKRVSWCMAATNTRSSLWQNTDACACVWRPQTRVLVYGKHKHVLRFMTGTNKCALVWQLRARVSPETRNHILALFVCAFGARRNILGLPRINISIPSTTDSESSWPAPTIVTLARSRHRHPG